MNKICILGSTGQLGTQLVKLLDNDCISLSHSDVEITDFDKVNKIITELNPSVIINTTQYHNVKLCETNPDKQIWVNQYQVKNLQTIANKINQKFVTISTDYVFDGTKSYNYKPVPYLETDFTNPLNKYGLSKLIGEQFTTSSHDKYFIIRTQWLYGLQGIYTKRGNFITRLLETYNTKDSIYMVNDQYGQPTDVKYLQEQILQLINTDEYGIYHQSCETPQTWFDFQLLILKTLNLNINKLIAVSTNEDEMPHRPKFQYLSKTKISAIYKFPEWDKQLKDFLQINKDDLL